MTLNDLESLESIRRIKISQINDCVDRGYLGKRKELLNEVFKLDREIKEMKHTNHLLNMSVYFHGRIYKTLDVSGIDEETLNSNVWDDDGYIEYR